MADRIVLNTISYHGHGAIENIVPELTARGYKKAFVCSDPDLLKFGVTKKVTDLLDAAGILEYEKVQIVDVNNGSRFETYTISGERGSGMICLNGAAARCVSTGDKVIIMCYAQLSAEEAKTHKPQVVFVDDDNRIERVTTYEKHGLLRDMA